MSAVYYLFEKPEMTAEITRLGYPIYFIKLLGIAKILGIAVLVSRIKSTVREWVYAGFTYDLIFAAFSHISMGDPFLKVATPIVFLIMLGFCYGVDRGKI
jgi:hypothetical protein